MLNTCKEILPNSSSTKQCEAWFETPSIPRSHLIACGRELKEGTSYQVPARIDPAGNHGVGEAVWSQHLNAALPRGTGNC